MGQEFGKGSAVLTWGFTWLQSNGSLTWRHAGRSPVNDVDQSTYAQTLQPSGLKLTGFLCMVTGFPRSKEPGGLADLV